ncbi:MAG: DAK2 domain-containing protein [Anaerolineales bacterium]|nr:DAK2 domain-containing protein [Anaerolineales bacterium]
MTTPSEPDTLRPDRQILLARALPHCDGLGLKHLTLAGLTWLETNHKAVNALNVFPVPDGDTGTNMLMTMQAAYAEIANSTEANVSRVAHALAHGALMGARGNSGVILSQIWRGFARGLGTGASFDATALALALAQASETAYRGVGKPVEGTILTVIKDTAAAAETATAGGDLRQMLTLLVEAAFASVARTPELMPLLKQAGVVDSGGKGLAFIIEGMLRYLRGQPLDASEAVEVVPLDLSAVGAALDAAEPGQEWEVVVDFRPRNGLLHLPTLYSKLEELGTSIQVGEGDGLWRAHIHLLKVRRHMPIELAEELGTVVKVHMENLLDQVSPGASGEAPLALHPAAPEEIAVVAVSPGPGLARIMASLGVAGIVNGGQSMNPSTQDILEAIGQVAAGRVIVLPNNKNIILAAQQAAELSVKEVVVVPATTVPQGLAALLNFLPFGPKGELAKVRAAMERDLAGVQSGEVTTASRSVELDGLAVAEGQIIGLHNGKLAAAGASVPQVTLALLEKMGGAALGVATLYYGAEITPDEAERLGAEVLAALPNLGKAEGSETDNLQVLPGGQPYYHYIISAE